MNDSAELTQLLKQVNRPIFAIEKNDSIDFISRDVRDICESAGKESPYHIRAFVPPVEPEKLGDKNFKNRHGLKYPYIAGAMANGITSADIVTTMAENGMAGFFGAGGLSLEDIEKNIFVIKERSKNKVYGFNLIHSLGDQAHEMATAQLYLKHGIRLISAAAFMRMTPALVYYRIKGIHENREGRIIAPNHVIAKVSRIEIASQFFSPPPDKIVSSLLEKGLITRDEARLSQHIPMAQDLTAEADSGGHTDNRPALSLLPTMIALKNEYMKKYNYPEPICIGLGGGIATPQSTAAAFSMGAAYVLTGSVNQSCVEAGICRDVKEMLCQAQQADVAMAPAADMFEIGARVQVLKRGTMFPVRAEKLYKYYQSSNSFEDIEQKARDEIEQKFLMSSFDDAWTSTKQFFRKIGKPQEIERAEADPRHKMALVFRSYLGLSSKWAIEGIPERKMDYQIWCGPSIGAFNQWVKGSFLESPENRKVDEIAFNLLFGACVSLRAFILQNQGIEFSPESDLYSPVKKQELFAQYMV